MPVKFNQTKDTTVEGNTEEAPKKDIGGEEPIEKRDDGAVVWRGLGASLGAPWGYASPDAQRAQEEMMADNDLRILSQAAEIRRDPRRLERARARWEAFLAPLAGIFKKDE